MFRVGYLTQVQYTLMHLHWEVNDAVTFLCVWLTF